MKDWEKILSKEEYKVMREKGTENPFSGEYVHNKDDGIYICKGCDTILFSSKTKYESGTGWPSFYEPHNQNHITEKVDVSHGMVRHEVLCAKCNAHLGHVFKDGPRPTGLRYCINSISLKFQKK